MWMTSVVLVAYLLVPCFQRVYATSCYYPDGTLSKDGPCSSGADSACCGSGAICLSNGLCLSTVQPFGLSRGSCTDPSYKIKECTKLCTNIQRNAGCSIVLYNNTESTTQYCCNSIVNNPNGSLPFCDQGLNTIEVDSASMIAGIAALADYTRIDDSTKTTSSAASPTSPTSNTPDNINSHGSSSHEVAVGVGVGVPLGVIAVIFLVWALWERRSRLGIMRNSSYAGVHSAYALTPVTNLSGGSSQKPEYSRHLVLGPAELDVDSQANHSRS